LPAITAVTPNTGQLGATLSVIVTGQFTHFVSGTTTANFGPGITVNSVTVASSTSATANITIGGSALTGPRDLVLTTSSEVVTASGGFTVNTITPMLVGVSPNSGPAGQTLTVSLTGQSTTFVQDATTANFGSGITVNSVTVGNPTTASVNISIDAGADSGLRNITLTTGAEIVTAANAFTVTGLPISLTSPTPGSTVSGSVVVSATATGAAGVQFKLDGMNLGGEITSPPYSINWNTLAASNGVHNLVAVARNVAGALTPSLSVTVTVSNATSNTYTYNVPANGGVSFVTTDVGSSGISVSHAMVQADASLGAAATQSDPAATNPPAGSSGGPTGVAIFGFRANDGSLVTEAGVPAAAQVLSGRIYAEVHGPVNTGIALSNTTVQDAQISFYFTDQNGNDLGFGSMALPAGHQIAAFLNQTPFNGPADFMGTFTFQSSVPLNSIALRGLTNERSEFLMTTLPVAPVGPGGSGTILPHFADGGGWRTQVILTNASDFQESGTIQFYGQGAGAQNALLINLSVNGVLGSTFSYTIPPHSMYRLVTDGSNYLTQVGSVRIRPAAAGSDTIPSAFAIFSFRSQGITVSEASVLAPPLGTSYQMYLESSGVIGQPGTIQTGFAVANPSSDPLDLTIQISRMDGTPIGAPATIQIPRGGQVAKFINELFDGLPTGFQGIGKLTTSSPVAVTGLRGRYNERGDFLITTTPPSDDAIVKPMSFVFPHVVTGQGYSTQLILFGEPGTGRLFLKSQSGNMQTNANLIGQ
jgi:hypothetical protein